MFGRKREDGAKNIPVSSHDDVSLAGQDLGPATDQQPNNQIPNQSVRDQNKADADKPAEGDKLTNEGDADPESALTEKAKAEQSKPKKKLVVKKRSRKQKDCPDCEGSGLKDFQEKGFDASGHCEKCKGSGKVR